MHAAAKYDVIGFIVDLPPFKKCLKFYRSFAKKAFFKNQSDLILV
jgi:hypothetical protein